MKKLLFIFALCLMFFLLPIKMSAMADGENCVRVIYGTVELYNFANASGEAEVVATAKYGDKLKLLQESKVLGDDDLDYYYVAFGEQNCYVLASFVCQDENASPKRQLDTNASLLDDAVVYNKSADNYEETETVLKAGDSIKVLDGLDYSKVYTKIQYQDDNLDIFVGYIKTSTIKKGGISRTTIGAICIIVATVSIVLVSFGIKARLKKKIRQK